MVKLFKVLLLLGLLMSVGVTFYYVSSPSDYEGVEIYKNLGENTRHLSEDGYNYGLKWQCVEFVKRYYYDKLGHEMPDTYGHAKHFFDKSLPDGAYNKARGLYQYSNNGTNVPEKGDLIVFNGRYGHVAIVDKVYKKLVLIYQQNTPRSRVIVPLEDKKIMGWLKSPHNE
jgi:surface antigen